MECYLPFEFVVGPSGERRRFEYLTHFFPTEAEVVYRPHVAELDHLHLCTQNLQMRHHVRVYPVETNINYNLST